VNRQRAIDAYLVLDRDERGLPLRHSFSLTLTMVESRVIELPTVNGAWKRNRPPAHIRRGKPRSGRKSPLAGCPSVAICD
jgi:hypothetical protein